MKIKLVTSELDLDIIRNLFLEYQAALNIDLCFQDFNAELKNLPGNYVSPLGRIYLGMDGNKPIGCIALRPFAADRCEMKRLYIRPDYRGQNRSKLLAIKLIAAAKEIGYHEMLLDTLPAMKAAIHLYQSLGFKDIDSYRYNPIPGAKYMALKLH